MALSIPLQEQEAKGKARWPTSTPTDAAVNAASRKGAEQGLLVDQDDGHVVIELPLLDGPGDSVASATSTYTGSCADNTETAAEAKAAPFPWWQKPAPWTAAATALVDVLTWSIFLGVGIPLDSYKLSTLVAAAVALAGAALQAYRLHVEKSLRIGIKLHPALMTATW